MQVSPRNGETPSADVDGGRVTCAEVPPRSERRRCPDFISIAMVRSIRMILGRREPTLGTSWAAGSQRHAGDVCTRAGVVRLMEEVDDEGSR